MPGTGCFLCNGTDHWADNCPEKLPPKDKAEYDVRIAKYVKWWWDFRITAEQKQKLITMLNEMKPERKSA